MVHYVVIHKLPAKIGIIRLNYNPPVINPTS